MNKSTDTDAELFGEASDWFLRVRAADATTDDHVAWLAWIEAEPAHRRAFDEVQQLWDVVGEVKSPPWPRPEELAPAAVDSTSGACDCDAPVSPQRSERNRLSSSSAASQQRHHGGTRRATNWLSAAAAVVLGIATLMLVDRHFALFDPVERIATSRGEQQFAVLPDGSRVELGGATSVALDFTPEHRLVIADEGEVFYRVQKDPERPFIVQSGPVTVRAVGTAFSVRREGDAVSVVVAEGVVEVQSANGAAGGVVRAKAGERVRYDRGELSPDPVQVSTSIATAWRRGQLRFEGEPLRVVVASLNRYTPREIVVSDPSLQDLQFTGSVFDDSVDDWLQGIQVIFPVTVDRTDPRRVVIAPRE